MTKSRTKCINLTYLFLEGGGARNQPVLHRELSYKCPPIKCKALPARSVPWISCLVRFSLLKRVSPFLVTKGPKKHLSFPGRKGSNIEVGHTHTHIHIHTMHTWLPSISCFCCCCCFGEFWYFASQGCPAWLILSPSETGTTFVKGLKDRGCCC